MAGRAGDLGMRTGQRELRLRVIECANLAPILLAMAALARIAKPSLVLVILPVAIDTAARRASEFDLRRVAAFARHLLMAAR